jgi:hypothetical protein
VLSALERFSSLSQTGKFLLLLAIALVTRASGFFISMFNPDEATYSAIGAKILAGGLPYVSAVDHKPAGIYWFYSLLAAIAGPYQLWFARAVLILVVAATAWIIAKIGERLVNHPMGAVAGLFYVICCTFGYPRDSFAVNTEILNNLPLALAGWLVLSCRSDDDDGIDPRKLLALLAAGILTALATTIRYQAGLAGIGWATFAFFCGGSWRSRILGPLALLLGFVLVAASYLGMYYFSGQFDQLLFWGWQFNVQYMSTLPASGWLRLAVERVPQVIGWWLPLWLLVGTSRLDTPAKIFVLSWLGTSIASVIPGGRFMVHYFAMVLPPVCLLAMAGRPWAAWRLKTAAVLMVLLAVVSASMAWSYYQIRPSLGNLDRVYRTVGGWVNSNTQKEDRLFVWGSSMEIYTYSKRIMGTRFVFTNYQTGKIWDAYDEADALGTEKHIVWRSWDELFEDLSKRPPEIIVDAAAGKLDGFDLHPISRYQKLADIVSRDYSRIATVDGVPIYRRNKY